LRIKRLENPPLNYKAAIEDDLRILRLNVNLRILRKYNAFMIETGQFGYIVLLQDGEVAGLITNKNVSLIDKDELDNTVDASDITEALLYKVISKSLPVNQINDYLPTLLIFFELLGLRLDCVDFGFWKNKYLNNQFCLTTGRKLEDPGKLFAYDDDIAFKDTGSNKGKSNYRAFTQPSPKSSGPKVKEQQPGIFLYRKIVENFMGQTLQPAAIYEALKNYIEISLKLLSTQTSSKYGYNPEDLNPTDKKYIESNLQELINEEVVMFFDRGTPSFIINYYLLFEKINLQRKTKNKLSVENYLINLNLIKEIILNKSKSLAIAN